MLDLKDDPALIAEYEQWHRPGIGWPEVRQNDLDAGVLDLQIYRLGMRMVMVLETDDGFTFEKKREMDAVNPKVQEWEQLMWGYQEALPTAKAGEKWSVMNQLFQFERPENAPHDIRSDG